MQKGSQRLRMQKLTKTITLSNGVVLFLGLVACGQSENERQPVVQQISFDALTPDVEVADIMWTHLKLSLIVRSPQTAKNGLVADVQVINETGANVMFRVGTDGCTLTVHDSDGWPIGNAYGSHDSGEEKVLLDKEVMGSRFPPVREVVRDPQSHAKISRESVSALKLPPRPVLDAIKPGKYHVSAICSLTAKLQGGNEYFLKSFVSKIGTVVVE
jgi:hypothetical protein